MSTNARPTEHPLKDDTLRRVGERDLSGDNEGGTQPPLPNPRIDIYEPQIGGRSQIGSNDWELHVGTPPERIDRIHSARIFGLIGKNVFGLDRYGEHMRVGHVPASHPNRPSTSGSGVASADDMYIPSVKIGAPL